MPFTSEAPGGYVGSLVRTITQYQRASDVPRLEIERLGQTYHQSDLQVMADLAVQEVIAIPVTPPQRRSPDSSSVRIPAATWNRETVLDPSYERLLEGVIRKYHGVAFVPEDSVVWIARRQERSSTQVKYDLQRVQRHDPDHMHLEGFAH